MHKKFKEKIKSIKINEWIYITIVIIIGIFIAMNSLSLKHLGFNLTKENSVNNIDYYTPHVSLPSGNYTLQIDGENINGSVISVMDYDGNILAEGNISGNSIGIDLNLEQENSDIYVGISGGGSLKKLNISSESPIYSDYYFIALLVVLCLLYIGYIIFRKRSGNCTSEIIMVILLASAIMSSYPLFTDYIYSGHDIIFHSYRIEGIKDGLLSGQFPVRIHPTHNNGYGYITPCMYPELFLYFPAILRLLGISFVTSYHMFLLAINIATAFITYKSVKEITKSKYTAVVAAIVYVFAAWRFTNVYQRAAIGETLAMAFFPLIAWGMYELIFGNKDKWYVLAIGATCIIQSHIISTFLTAIVAAVIALVFIKTILSEDRWKQLLKCLAVTLLLNLWFIVPFINSYMGLDLVIANKGFYDGFAYDAVFPAQLFNIFNNKFGMSTNTFNGIQGEMSLSLGLTTSLCVVIYTAYLLFEKKKDDKNNKFVLICFIIGVALTVMSTTLFPWGILLKNKFINLIVKTIQFPFRFLSLASILLCIPGAFVIGRKISTSQKQNVLFIICIVCGLSMVMFGTEFTGTSTVAHMGETVRGSSSVGWDNEYFISGTDKNKLEVNQYKTSESNIKVNEYSKNKTNIKFSISGNADGDSYVELPLLYYPGYKAVTDAGERLDVTCGNNNVLRVNLDGNSNCEINVKYSGTVVYKIATAISILTILYYIFMYYYIWRRRKNEK